MTSAVRQLSADFGAKTAVPPLVDHDLVSRRIVKAVMALGQACVGLACWRAI